jgi:hypothetical protein
MRVLDSPNQATQPGSLTPFERAVAAPPGTRRRREGHVVTCIPNTPVTSETPRYGPRHGCE